MYLSSQHQGQSPSRISSIVRGRPHILQFILRPEINEPHLPSIIEPIRCRAIWPHKHINPASVPDLVPEKVVTGVCYNSVTHQKCPQQTLPFAKHVLQKKSPIVTLWRLCFLLLCLQDPSLHRGILILFMVIKCSIRSVLFNSCRVN